jgi:histidyl-tRNA synthetase
MATRTVESDSMLDGGLRSQGMRDLGPGTMRRFRAIEHAFLETTSARGYQEIRTPTIEPLHLFTATGALSPQLLDRVYSFLDWDGWSGERVVLRPDTTVPAARWYAERWQDSAEPARLSYVQPVYRFVPPARDEGDRDREQWQCGVELFGLGAPHADIELLLLARDFLQAVGLSDLRFEIAHAGLIRMALAAAGLDPAAQADAYDRLLTGDDASVLSLHDGGVGLSLRLLFDVEGRAAGYVENARAALLPVVPAASKALDELSAAAKAMEDADCEYRILHGTARNFEYYTGITFRVLARSTACLSGGRYDGLGEALGGRAVPASGFGCDVLQLADLLAASPLQ